MSSLPAPGSLHRKPACGSERRKREREREREQMADKQSAGVWIFAYKTGLQVASHSYLAHAHICTGVGYAVIC